MFKAGDGVMVQCNDHGKLCKFYIPRSGTYIGAVDDKYHSVLVDFGLGKTEEEYFFTYQITPIAKINDEEL